MKIDVDFTEITLAAAKMQGLDAYLNAIRRARFTFDIGLNRAIEYVSDNQGSVLHTKGVTRLRLGTEEAYVFQPYDDIDRFYFES